MSKKKRSTAGQRAAQQAAAQQKRNPKAAMNRKATAPAPEPVIYEQPVVSLPDPEPEENIELEAGPQEQPVADAEPQDDGHDPVAEVKDPPPKQGFFARLFGSKPQEEPVLKPTDASAEAPGSQNEHEGDASSLNILPDDPSVQNTESVQKLWTEEEDAVLQKFYTPDGGAAINGLPGRTGDACQQGEATHNTPDDEADAQSDGDEAESPLADSDSTNQEGEANSHDPVAEVKDPPLKQAFFARLFGGKPQEEPALATTDAPAETPGSQDEHEEKAPGLNILPDGPPVQNMESVQEAWTEEEDAALQEFYAPDGGTAVNWLPDRTETASQQGGVTHDTPGDEADVQGDGDETESPPANSDSANHEGEAKPEGESYKAEIVDVDALKIQTPWSWFVGRFSGRMGRQEETADAPAEAADIASQADDGWQDETEGELSHALQDVLPPREIKEVDPVDEPHEQDDAGAAPDYVPAILPADGPLPCPEPSEPPSPPTTPVETPAVTSATEEGQVSVADNKELQSDPIPASITAGDADKEPCSDEAALIADEPEHEAPMEPALDTNEPMEPGNVPDVEGQSNENLEETVLPESDGQAPVSEAAPQEKPVPPAILTLIKDSFLAKSPVPDVSVADNEEAADPAPVPEPVMTSGPCDRPSNLVEPDRTTPPGMKRAMIILGALIPSIILVLFLALSPFILGIDLPSWVTLETGSSRMLSPSYVTVGPSGGKRLSTSVSRMGQTWVSSDEGVVSVSDRGLITAVAPGQATITLTSDNGWFTASTRVTVSTTALGAIAVEKLSLDGGPSTMASLNAEIVPSNATGVQIAYASSDESVAVVTNTGYVVGVSPGQCRVISFVVDNNGNTLDLPATITDVTVGPAPRAEVGLGTLPRDEPELDENGEPVYENWQDNPAIGPGMATIPFYASVEGEPTYSGRWSIPDVRVDVACYWSGDQEVCDASDSAVMFNQEGQTLIGDHKDQGFDRIGRCEPGMTAYLERPSGSILELECVEVIQGINVAYGVIGANGELLGDLNPDGYACYTCNDDQQTVTIALFQPIT